MESQQGERRGRSEEQEKRGVKEESREKRGAGTVQRALRVV